MVHLGIGEPGLGTCIIFAGVWINRNITVQELLSSIRQHSPFHRDAPHVVLPEKAESDRFVSATTSKRRHSNATPSPSRWRNRDLSLFGCTKTIQTPNTAIWQYTLQSRILRNFPFFMEVVYWGLIYCVYQFGRSRLAIWRPQDTIDVSRRHAFQVIRLEEHLHLFIEPAVQRFFLQSTTAMWWTNRIYSYLHLPATISFLVGLYWYCVTRTRSNFKSVSSQTKDLSTKVDYRIYEARRRALAVSNLLAFIVFSTWPCMPPRLLDDKDGGAIDGQVGRRFGFVDTVHVRNGAVSVWNQRKYTNQLAAMPSLHFGYALLIGLTLATLPLGCSPQHSRSRTRRCTWCSWQCTLVRAIGVIYPSTILLAVIATANHFVLDSVAGAAICGIAWHWNGIMLNLLPLQDVVLWCLRIHTPSAYGVDDTEQLPY